MILLNLQTAPREQLKRAAGIARTKMWIRNNPERYRASRKAHKQKNVEKIREFDRFRSFRRREELLARRRANWAINGRSKTLRWKWGLTIAEYAAMLESQGGLCAICRTDRPGPHGVFRVDHDHATGEIRGLLCNTCNLQLGKWKDDPAVLRAAIAYLEFHKEKQS